MLVAAEEALRTFVPAAGRRDAMRTDAIGILEVAPSATGIEEVIARSTTGVEAGKVGFVLTSWALLLHHPKNYERLARGPSATKTYQDWSGGRAATRLSKYLVDWARLPPRPTKWPLGLVRPLQRQTLTSAAAVEYRQRRPYANVTAIADFSQVARSGSLKISW